MKKLLLLLFIFTSIISNGQEWNKIWVRDEISLSDSIVTGWNAGFLPDVDGVISLIGSTPVSAVGFDGEVQLAASGVLSSDFNFSWDGNALYLSSGIGSDNILIGEGAGNSMISGGKNIAMGAYAGGDLTIGSDNTFIGTGAGNSCVSGNDNTSIGNSAGSANNGSENVFIGNRAGQGFAGDRNVYLGDQAGYLGNGDRNIMIGYEAGYNNSSDDKLYIDNSDTSTPLIYGEFDNNYVKINDNLEVAKSITLGQTTDEDYKEGKLFYDTTSHALTFNNDIQDFNHSLGFEHLGRFYNDLGVTITKGTALTPVGVKINGVVTPSAILAGNGSKDSLNLIALAAADVAPGEFGNVLLMGALEFYNTSAFNDNDLIYIGKAGGLTNVKPEAPDFSLPIGKCFYADNDSGVIYMLPQGVAIYDPIPSISVSFSRELETITNPGITTPALITNATNDLYTNDYSIGFTLQGDTINPLQDGIYTIFASFAYQGDAASADDWRVGVFKNGVEQFSVLRTTSSSNKGVVGLGKIISLTTSDWISFKIENTTSATRDAIFTDGVINVEFITTP